MSRIGLALSGGGFRATLYHLGVIRYLRDTKMLSEISHITCVSGGSIMATHLVLNWDRYNGTEQEFDKAAEELLDFIRMDIRNRVVRRFPLASVANNLRFLVKRKRTRRLTRSGLLETHYEKFLYGDKCLYELPAFPQLHILATNVNEGCLCSFTRSGLLVQRRMPDGSKHFELVSSALATISMAVTASSAFPGFFPPLLLKAEDVGAEESRFPPLIFTDGGIYDNLGVRMFRWIQHSWIGHNSPFRSNDFIHPENSSEIMKKAKGAEEVSPLSRLVDLVQKYSSENNLSNLNSKNISEALWNVIVHEQLYKDPLFQDLELQEEQAADLHHLAKSGRALDYGDHLWLNKCLVNTAYHIATGDPLLKSINTEFDAVIVSDAGKQFTISHRTRSGGLLGTAMRASDILMDRVWQLENDHFKSEPDFIFVPMHETMHLADDPNALHPEIQKQVKNARTDLDRFSELEMSGLIRHGYGVMRKVSKLHPELFGENLQSDPPWDPTFIKDENNTSLDSPSQVTLQARELQGASHRQILGNFLSFRDWPTYVFLPLILFLIIGVPYFAYDKFKIARRSTMIIDTFRYSNPDYQLVMELAQHHPVSGDWEPLPVEEVPEIKPPNIGEFDFLTDTRVIDMRNWKRQSQEPNYRFISYRRLLVRRNEIENSADQPEKKEGILRFQQFVPIRDISMRCDTKELNPIFRIKPQKNRIGVDGYLSELEFDLSNVPVGDHFPVGYETMFPEYRREMDKERLVIPIVAKTHLVSFWVILPVDHPYESFKLVKYETESPTDVDAVEPTYNFQMKDGSLFGWMVVAPQEKHSYECEWTWREE
jgi:predicted acylesterase/phospholipase RssA